MLHNKKASLEISIQAIVIVVLAMTLLGLGLGFIRKQFATLGDTASQVQEQIKQQILDDLRSSDKKLSFPANEVVIQKKDSKVLALGIKNTKSLASKYSIVIKTINTNDGLRSDPTEDDGVFIYNKGLQPLGVNDARVIPVKYTAPTAVTTKTFEIVVCDCGDAAATPCLAVSSTPEKACDDSTKEYDSKTFFITIT